MNLEQRTLELTVALYKVTDLFPEDEALKQALRKQGLEILELVIRSDDKEETANSIKIIRYYLQLAKNLRVTKTVNFDVLQREYTKLAENFSEAKRPAWTIHHKPATSSHEKSLQDKEVNERQNTIIEYLKHKKQAKVGDLQDIFKNISSKTIQRDLQDLVARNILSRDGDKRWTTYYLTDKVQ